MQPPPPWKKALFTTIGQIESAIRGSNPLAPADLRQIRNFLVLQYDAPLGSVVHATPLFEALKRSMPDAHVTVAASSMAASVLGNDPSIDRCIATPGPYTNFAKAIYAIRRLSRAMPPGPRSIVTTIGNQRTRLAMLGLAAGKAVRAGYTLAPDIYDFPLDFRPMHGQIEGNLDILRALGHDVAFCEPRIFFQQADADIAARMLDDGNGNTASPWIAFVTRNSGGQPNQWSEERFAQVVAALSQTHHAVPVFVGTSRDADAIEALRRSLPVGIDRGISLAGKTTIPQLAAVLAQCDLAVSLDTGTFHVARAVGLPGVVIAPAWQSALEWLPVGRARYRVLQGPHIPKPGPDYRIDEITVPQVIEAAEDVLKEFPSGSASRRIRVDARLAISNLE